MLPPLARVDLGALAIKGYSAFPEDPALLDPHQQIVECHIKDLRWESLTLSSEMLSVYSAAPAQLGHIPITCNLVSYQNTLWEGSFPFQKCT